MQLADTLLRPELADSHTAYSASTNFDVEQLDLVASAVLWIATRAATWPLTRLSPRRLMYGKCVEERLAYIVTANEELAQRRSDSLEVVFTIQLLD